MTKKKELNPLLKGEKYGRLTVIKFDHKKQYINKKGEKRHRFYYQCLCECGNKTIVEKQNLKTGKIVSCGCYAWEKNSKLGKSQKKHGKSRTKLYSIWTNMKCRCFNPKHRQYYLYGERGITVCAEWIKSYEIFEDWALNNGYQEGLSIDRVDVNGNYEPSNCRWATAKEQSNNKRTNHFVIYKNKTQTVTEWAEEFNFSPSVVQSRLKNGWTIEEALTTPIGQKRKKKKQGES